MADISEDFSVSSIESLARKIIHYWTNIYIISPVELASFVKIKGNLLRQGIILDEDTLNLPVTDLASWLERKLSNKSNFSTQCDNFTNDKNLDKLLDIDTDVIETERQDIRRQLFKEEIKIRIRQSVKSFSIQCNKKMSVWDIRIPASWDVAMEQSFLLSLYDKTFHQKSTKEESEQDSSVVVNQKEFANSMNASDKLVKTDMTDSISKYTSFIIAKHNDFALIRADLDVFLSEQKDLTTLELGDDVFGDDLPLSSIIILKVLSDSIRNKTITKSLAIAKLGTRRKRLINKLQDFLVAKK